jgi:toxin ParE1/3/4
MAQGGKRVVWSPRARQDLHDIWRYFARVASPDIADNLLREIAGVKQRLGERPLVGRTREEVAPGLRSILIHPYSVFYRVTDSSVEIARVLHERRNFASVFAKDER